jgi:hypothetical protein
MHQSSLLENVLFVSLVAWPGVVVGCALLNMLFQLSFSWSELIIDYLAGIAIGLCFHFGTQKGAGPAEKFFLVFSSGLPGLLHVLNVKALQPTNVLFAVTAGMVGGSVVLAGLLELATKALGLEMGVGGGLLSILIAPLKLCFSFFTTAVGLVIWLAGFVWFLIRKAQEDKSDPSTLDRARIGFLGGVPYAEFDYQSNDRKATTLGATVLVWSGKASRVLKHEFYHTKQYIFLHDWLIPFWLLGGLWGMISAGIYNAAKDAAAKDIDVLCSFIAANGDSHEVGNPIERAAYRADGESPCMSS